MTTSPSRPYRILWANAFCLLDTSSGASMAVRRILDQLKTRGVDVRVLGASVFDTPHGTALWREKLATCPRDRRTVVEFDDDDIPYRTVLTRSNRRFDMTAREENIWYDAYRNLLDDFRPDMVMTYGGSTLDLLIMNEARRRGIPVSFYLGNGNYHGTNWCRDVDLILTDSDATAGYYREKEGFEVHPVGTFIRPEEVVTGQGPHNRVLFVNPDLKKGAAIVAALAARLEKRRPYITFEVVEARGNWKTALRVGLGRKSRVRAPLENVVLTPNTKDMRPVFARARLLLAPSLLWESAGRVAAEALMNGIPVLASNVGGLPEQIGEAGLLFDFPTQCHERPFDILPPQDVLGEMAGTIERLFDDEAFYQRYTARAQEVVAQRHDIEKNTDRLIGHLMPLLERRAGDGDFAATLRQTHRHGHSIVNVH